jgi:hypothetical protein
VADRNSIIEKIKALLAQGAPLDVALGAVATRSSEFRP